MPDSSGQPSQLYDDSNPDWAPSLELNMGWVGSNDQPAHCSQSRYERIQQRREKRRRVEACEGLLSLSEVRVWSAWYYDVLFYV